MINHKFVLFVEKLRICNHKNTHIPILKKFYVLKLRINLLSSYINSTYFEKNQHSVQID